mmetsp:Transcript_70616/g.169200  ORF Transcript_70616/g.169200 Transcript_70616/m.169200 type:complete len:146 (-) Transcript_70616:1266-1703(-)
MRRPLLLLLPLCLAHVSDAVAVQNTLLRHQRDASNSAARATGLFPGDETREVSHPVNLLKYSGGGGRRIQDRADQWLARVIPRAGHRKNLTRGGWFAGLQATESRRKSWRVEDIPNPTTNPEACGFKEPSFVCDPDGFLSPEGPG